MVLMCREHNARDIYIETNIDIFDSFSEAFEAGGYELKARLGNRVSPTEIGVLAVPMVMGANIGTTVTSTLASLGSIRRPEEFRRAFAAATVHDFFNLLAVAILLPVELATGALSGLAAVLTDLLVGRGVESGGMARSPIRAVVRLPVDWVAAAMDHSGRISTRKVDAC